MPSIRFDPRIATDLQIDWRRADTGRTSDLFADLLADRMERNAEADRRSLAAARPHPLPDAVSGRPRRPVIEHPRTLRGEAKEIDAPGQRVGHHKRHSPEENGGQAASATKDADSGMEQEAAETTAETESPNSETVAAEASGQVAEETAGPTQPTDAVAVVPTQQSEQAAADDGLTVTVALPVSSDPASVAPEPARGAAAHASEEALEAEALDQQTVAAMAAAGLSQVAADVKAGGSTVEGTSASVAAGLQDAAAAVPVHSQEAAVQITLIATPAPDALPAPVQAQPIRPSMDAKLPSKASARANGGAPAPAANAATQQSAQAAALPPGMPGEFGGMGGMFEHPLSADGAGPGWTLHLAQGAAGRRAEFLAQLRQHLQNLPAHEQVAVHIQRAVREGTGRLSVQLSPAELGRIHLKLEIDEDKHVKAVVTVERPSTLELLQRDVRGLERALHNAGLAMEGGDLSFSLGGGNDQEFAQDLNQQAASAAGGSVLDGQAVGDPPAGSAAQLMDTAAGVVDLQV